MRNPRQFSEKLVQHQQNKLKNMAWLDGIVSKVIDLQDGSGVRAVRSWCSFAFKRDHIRDPTIPYPNFVTIKIFIQFFWLLYLDKEDIERSKAFLIEERRKRRYHFPMPKSQQHRRESQLVTAKFKKVHQSETFAQNHNYNDKMSLKNIDTLKTKTKLVPSKKLDEEKSANDSMLIDEEDPILLNDHSNVRSPLQPPRQTLPMYPPIWAHSRQEVCESFGWFRSYQGGVYHSNNAVRGYLLSAFSSSRDRFEHGGRLIISHGGGKGENLRCYQGKVSVQMEDDQLAQDISVRALLRNYHEGRPLVLLIDNKYILFPYDLSAKDVTYAVLGYYDITNAWGEYQPANNERGRVVRYKFAFQWCEDQGEPWWLKKNSDIVVEKADDLLADTFQTAILPEKLCELRLSQFEPPMSTSSICDSCVQESPQVYAQSWACLNPSCNKFWITLDDQPLPDQLDYNPRFLELLPEIQPSKGYGRLLPSPPLVHPTNEAITNYRFSRGWHCSKCGRLSCRFKWEQWECLHCQEVHIIPIKVRSPREFWAHAMESIPHDYHVAKESGIHQQPQVFYTLGHGQSRTFVLPHNRGRIHHIRSSCPEGRLCADNIFQEYQEQALNGSLAFRRWPLQSHKCRGTLLSNYYSHNTGEPYQYVGGTSNTVPFNEAPNAVVKARELIQLRLHQALGLIENFNEILSAAYMERQKMAFHSDSEKGLGPIVAGLSLGAPAVMHFRLQKKFDPSRELGGDRIALSFVLRHGDVLVMDGAGVQEYYEHTVIPTDQRIAATARCIKADHA